MPRRALALSIVLASCGPRAPAPEARPVSAPTAAHDAAATDAPASIQEPDSGAPDASVTVPRGVSEELTRAVEAYLAAANSGDHAVQRAGSTAECWEKECGSFAQQAGKKFRAERRESLRRLERHALVVVDILCEGDRKCDLVYVLFELEPSLRWVVTDVTEDGKKADAWVTPPGWVEPKMPPNVPPGAPQPPDTPQTPATPAPRPPKGNVEVGGVVGAQAVPDAARALARLRPGFKHCFLTGLQQDPQTAGKLVLEIDIGPAGEVVKAKATKVTGTLSSSVVACVQHRAAGAHFEPPTGGGAKLSVPISFAPVR